MRRIAICDDEPAQAELLRGFVNDWARDRREPSEIRLFPSGDAFWFCWEQDKAWDALLLDIQMSGTDGLDLCRQLRAAGSRLPVVFVTGLPRRSSAWAGSSSQMAILRMGHLLSYQSLYNSIGKIIFQELPQTPCYFCVSMLFLIKPNEG